MLRWAVRGATSALPSTLLAQTARWTIRLIARRFMVAAGPERVERVIRELEELGRLPSLDILGEAVLSDEEARTYQDQYLSLLDLLGRHVLAGRRTRAGTPFLEVSLKRSSLTPQFNLADPQGVARRVRPALEELFDAARRRGIGVTVDAEQSIDRDLTWRIVSEALAPSSTFVDWPDAGIVVQA